MTGTQLVKPLVVFILSCPTPYSLSSSLIPTTTNPSQLHVFSGPLRGQMRLSSWLYASEKNTVKVMGRLHYKCYGMSLAWKGTRWPPSFPSHKVYSQQPARGAHPRQKSRPLWGERVRGLQSSKDLRAPVYQSLSLVQMWGAL